MSADVSLPRVVFNGRFLAQVHTGVQRYAAETLRALDRLLQAEPALTDRVAFELARPDGAASMGLSAVREVSVSGRAGHVWEQLALKRHARGAYLVNFNYSGPLLKRRQLITVHDATVRVMPQAFSRSYRWVHNVLVSILGRTAQDVMTVSEFSRDELRHWFHLGRNDILVGREGGEHAVLATDDDAVLKRHGLQPGRYVLSVGSVKPNKNFGLIGRAMQRLGDYPLMVAVAGARDIGIFRDDEAPAQKGFRFLGFVPDAQLSALYRHAACFVFPSLYEGFGLPAIEAMAHDCPVLAAHAASVPEVCADAALYFDAHDPDSLASALRRIAAEPGLRATLVAAGRERLHRYNWTANAEILLERLRQRLPHAATLPAGPASTLSLNVKS